MPLRGWSAWPWAVRATVSPQDPQRWPGDPPGEEWKPLIRVGLLYLLRAIAGRFAGTGADNGAALRSAECMRFPAHVAVSLLSLTSLAGAQVIHTHEEVWTGGATMEWPHSGGVVGFATLSWPAVMGWWLGGGWPMVRLESTTVLDCVIPANPSGAPVRYGWTSYLHLNTYWRGLYWYGNDVARDEWTAGGTQSTPVHWESTRHIGAVTGNGLMWNSGGPQPVRIVSQVGESGHSGSPHFDAWYYDSSGQRVGVGATIDIETTVTATWTFDPPAITSWGSGDAGCGGVPNSTGQTGNLEIGGSPDLADDSTWVSAWSLPPSAFAIVVGADSAWPSPVPTTSVCLGGPQQRRIAVIQASAGGEIAYRLRAADFPSPHYSMQPIAYFQLWHRDSTTAGSNVTNAYRVRYEPL